VLDLPTRDQLRVFEALREQLSAEFGVELGCDREIHARQEALDALAAAAAHLGLQDGTAPSIPQYRRARKEQPGIGLSHQQIIRAWGRWDAATQAYGGGWTVPSPAQRAARRARLGRRRTHEELLTGVREWLATEPAATARADYEAWARERNERRASDELPVAVTTGHITARLGVGWADVIAAARGDVDLDERADEFRRTSLAAGGPLVGQAVVARILDTGASMIISYATRSSFPRPVGTVAGHRVWLRTDIEAYRDGKPFPKRGPSSLTIQLLDSSEVAQRLKVSAYWLRNLIHEEHWDRVPRPAGKVSSHYYWRRPDVDKWLRAHPDAGLRKRRRRPS
jgi:hypothetical protein